MDSVQPYWYSWRNQIAPLVNAGYRVVVPDQRGYNVSDKPSGVESYRIERLAADLRELIRACGRERAVLVAHDWGEAVACRCYGPKSRLSLAHTTHPPQHHPHGAHRRENRERNLGRIYHRFDSHAFRPDDDRGDRAAR